MKKQTGAWTLKNWEMAMQAAARILPLLTEEPQTIGAIAKQVPDCSYAVVKNALAVLSSKGLAHRTTPKRIRTRGLYSTYSYRFTISSLGAAFLERGGQLRA